MCILTKSFLGFFAAGRASVAFGDVTEVFGLDLVDVRVTIEAEILFFEEEMRGCGVEVGVLCNSSEVLLCDSKDGSGVDVSSDTLSTDQEISSKSSSEASELSCVASKVDRLVATTSAVCGDCSTNKNVSMESLGFWICGLLK